MVKQICHAFQTSHVSLSPEWSMQFREAFSDTLLVHWIGRHVRRTSLKCVCVLRFFCVFVSFVCFLRFCVCLCLCVCVVLLDTSRLGCIQPVLLTVWSHDPAPVMCLPVTPDTLHKTRTEAVRSLTLFVPPVLHMLKWNELRKLVTLQIRWISLPDAVTVIHVLALIIFPKWWSERKVWYGRSVSMFWLL
jgi:hypothetical protein